MLSHPDSFVKRHLGPNEAELSHMLEVVGASSLQELIDQTVPAAIRLDQPLRAQAPMSEHEYLGHIKEIASKNKVFRSYIGMGYYDTITPTVILRNIFENPGWYTQYTPYQAEIAQGRLEALLNFQTMVSDLVGLPLAGASLLDEATAAAEAMAMCFNIGRQKKTKFFVADDCHPQTIAVVRTRARGLGIEVVVGKAEGWLSLGFAWSFFGRAVHSALMITSVVSSVARRGPVCWRTVQRMWLSASLALRSATSRSSDSVRCRPKRSPSGFIASGRPSV